MRIAVAGVHIESSTFSPHRSVAEDFHVTRGEALLERYHWWRDGDSELTDGVEWVPILHAGALPGGVVEPEAYESWRAEILGGLDAAGRLDGVLLDIHGAMTAEGYDDVEGDLAARVRVVIGDAALISAAMDLHGNVSEELFQACDLLTCYRTAPHVDVRETRERAARNLVRCLRSGERPAKALVHVPVLLPGEMTSTRDEPAASLYGAVAAVAEREGLLDAAIWVGFAWADQPRCCGAVVVTGWDRSAVDGAANELAEHFWRVRREFEFVSPAGDFGTCLEGALAAVQKGRRPFFISDSGDNPGAGGADDVTVALAHLLAQEQIVSGQVRALLVSIVDPETVDHLAGATVGERVSATVGGRVDARAPGPIEVDGVLEAWADDPAGGRVLSLRLSGLSLVLTERRMQFNAMSSYERLSLHPVHAQIDVVVVKMGYLEPDLHEIAAGHRLALTPGGVDQDLKRLPYQRISRPMFPVDERS
ncbi:M81 family metallopeptidase [Demetria terragena]|uniref:M81 family metallopeptidase n=1 Tax=Demetria terragena TaxID=63959 RepID=UPI0003726EE1|nr:M81 family metallopeptidase [Demetria terragena]